MKTKLLCVLSFIVCVSGEANVDWWKNGVFYQTYPLSFKDSDNNGKGDLRGIISKLEHLQEAGITGAWLTPIYKSPQVDNGYDISDYREIDEMYGTMEDFEELIRKAHELGIKIIMDFVPNHSSDQHEWFQKSIEGEEPYKDYYVWIDTKSDTTPPNNWISAFHGPAWTYNEKRKQWYLHQFTTQQPDVDFRNPKVKQEFLDIMKFWMDKGVDGFRLDAVACLIEDKYLRNEEPSGKPVGPEVYESLIHTYTRDRPETYDLLYEWRDFIDVYNAEHPNEDPRIFMSEGYAGLNKTMLYYGNGIKEGPHIPFNFFLAFTSSKTSVTDIQKLINKWMDNMPSGKVANWVMGNHDLPRVATRFGPANVDGVHMLIGSLPGIMVTYNGEEIGLENGWVAPEDCVDPIGCREAEISMESYNATSRDLCRTPFHWDDTVNAGFNEGGKTWLPVSEKYKTNNLKAQKEAGSQSHFGVYRDIIQLRKKKAFVRGDFKVDVPSESVLRVTRNISDTEFYVTLINLGNKQELIKDATPFENYSKELKVEIANSNSKKRNSVLPSHNLVLEANEAIIASSYDATW